MRRGKKEELGEPGWDQSTEERSTMGWSAMRGEGRERSRSLSMEVSRILRSRNPDTLLALGIRLARERKHSRLHGSIP